MIASTRYKIAILAMTKTGTTAIESALAPYCEVLITGAPGLKHMTLKKFNRMVRPVLTSVNVEVETVCLIREPESWLGSWYRYRSRPGIPNKAKATNGVSFSEFVEAYLASDQPEFAKVGRPHRFVETSEGAMGVDHLFQYEQFGLFQAFIEQRFRRRFAFRDENTSPRSALSLPQSLRDRLRVELAEDYALHERARR